MGKAPAEDLLKMKVLAKKVSIGEGALREDIPIPKI